MRMSLPSGTLVLEHFCTPYGQPVWELDGECPCRPPWAPSLESAWGSGIQTEIYKIRFFKPGKYFHYVLALLLGNLSAFFLGNLLGNVLAFLFWDLFRLLPWDVLALLLADFLAFLTRGLLGDLLGNILAFLFGYLFGDLFALLLGHLLWNILALFLGDVGALGSLIRGCSSWGAVSGLWGAIGRLWWGIDWLGFLANLGVLGLALFLISCFVLGLALFLVLGIVLGLALLLVGSLVGGFVDGLALIFVLGLALLLVDGLVLGAVLSLAPGDNNFSKIKRLPRLFLCLATTKLSLIMKSSNVYNETMHLHPQLPSTCCKGLIGLLRIAESSKSLKILTAFHIRLCISFHIVPRTLSGIVAHMWFHTEFRTGSRTSCRTGSRRWCHTSSRTPPRTWSHTYPHTECRRRSHTAPRILSHKPIINIRV